MLDDRLDALLTRARMDEPDDDGFTDAVMARVRAVPATSRNWRRFVTRPVALAAAAALIAGGALAAVNTTAPDRAAAPEAERDTGSRSAPVATEAVPEDRATQRSGSDPAATSGPATHERTYRDGSIQWGYTSEHTAYVIDHDAELRMETETHTNAFDVGEPHRVTMTLTNLGDDPVGVYAPEGCALTVAAFQSSERSRDPSNYDGPSSARDPSQAKVWNCAGDGDPRPERHSEPDKFVLEPGASRTEHAMVVLTEPGDWAVLGMCQCSWMRPGDEPDREPSRPASGLLFTPAPDDGPTQRDPSGKGWRMFTPPIWVDAS